MTSPTPPLGRPLPPGLPVPRSKGKLMGVPGPQLLSRARRWRGNPTSELCPRPSRSRARSSLISPSTPPERPEGKRGEDGISQCGGSGFPAILSVYGEKGEMEKAGRRRLASAAPPLGWLRRCESGADEGGLGSLVRSSPEEAPHSGTGRPGSSLYHLRTSGPRRARLGKAGHSLRTGPSEH